MTIERRKLVTLHLFILGAMIVCSIFSFSHFSSHPSAFRLAFYGLLLINSWLRYRDNLKRRQPDTLIRNSRKDLI
jgi:hypothetical protein